MQGLKVCTGTISKDWMSLFRRQIMNKHNTQSILNILVFIAIAFSSGCGAVTAVPSPILTPVTSQMPEPIQIKGILVYSDFENIYAVDLQKQTTKIIFHSDHSTPQYFTADNILYIALKTTQNEEGIWRIQIFELGTDGNIGKQVTFVDDMRQIVGFNDKEGYLTYLSDRQSLILLDVKSKRTQIIANHDPNIAIEYIFPISWSPDNKKLLYGRFSMPDSATSACTLFLFDVEKNKSVELFPRRTSDMLAKWSPDGKNIALRLEDKDSVSGVYIFNVEAETLRQIPTNDKEPYFEGLSWSSNGEELFFSTGETVYLFDLISNQLDVISAQNSLDIFFVPSPDKSLILYEQIENNSTDLYLFHIFDKKAERIYSQDTIMAGEPTRWHYSSVWSPDNKYFIYFTTPEPNNDSRTRQILLNTYNIDSGNTFSFEVPTTSGYMVSGTYWIYS